MNLQGKHLAYESGSETSYSTMNDSPIKRLVRTQTQAGCTARSRKLSPVLLNSVQVHTSSEFVLYFQRTSCRYEQSPSEKSGSSVRCAVCRKVTAFVSCYSYCHCHPWCHATAPSITIQANMELDMTKTTSSRVWLPRPCRLPSYM